MIHQVDNVYEAVYLAGRLKSSREYDWFRGQTQNWPLVSSFCRVAEEQMDAVMEKLARYEHWIKSTPGLESIAASTDMAIAVAQHYGLPTNFVDFTTEPPIAGFFASHGTPSSSRPSCIMCLNTRELAQFWERLPQSKGGPTPEFIRLTVPNLWRLESQYGVFLFCPFPNFEEIYDLDRIIFPYTGPISEPPESLIYPSRKSQLEILLDRYFMNEQLVEGTRAVYAMSGSIRIHRIPTRPERCDRDLVPNGPPPRLASWDTSVLAPWRRTIPEMFSEKLTSEGWELGTNSKLAPPARLAQVSDQVQARLGCTPGARHSLLGWSLRLDGVTMRTYEAEAITRALQRLWDGLRLLPYSDHQIAAGIGCCAAIAVEWLDSLASERDDWEHICRRVFPDAMEVEFGSDDGSYSRTFVSESALLDAVRDDIGEFLNPAYADQILGNMAGLFQAIWAPDRLFEYDRLSHLFSSRIAPVQVWMREGSAIFYSPAGLDSFGLP